MTAEQIITAVSDITGVTIEEMIAPGRLTRRVYARTLAAHAIRTTCAGWSLQDIGEIFSMKHNNIAHMLTRHRRLATTDHGYMLAVEQLNNLTTNQQTKCKD